MDFDATLTLRTLKDVPALARAAEAIGFSAIWTSETLHDPFLPGPLIAEHTQNIHFGTAIAVSFARSPGTLAYTAWDLAQASGGRFILGLGTQVKAHIERRFGMEWPASPVGKLREQILAIRALWSTWQTRERLNFRGEYYKLTLMSPFFDPGPLEHPAIPVYIAGVNTGLAQLAGEIADGFHVHPFHTPAYLAEVLLPAIGEGLARGGRDRAAIKMNVTAFFATSEAEREFSRQQISFYASTPSYRPVMAFHGWDNQAALLSELAARGQWAEMPALVSDEMLETFAVTAREEELPDRLVGRYQNLADRLSLYTPFIPGQRDFMWKALIQAAAQA